MMRTIGMTSVAACVLAATMALAANAASVYWNTDQEISTPTGSDSDSLYVATTADATATQVAGGSLTWQAMDVGRGFTGILIVNDGTVSVSGTTHIGRGSTGVLTLNSGTTTFGTTNVGRSLSTNAGNGTINIAGGDLIVSGTMTVAYGTGGGAQYGAIIQTAGSASFNGSGGISLANIALDSLSAGSTALYRISGGSLTATRLYLGRSTGDVTAEFEVIGSAATISFTNYLDTYLNSTLSFTLDDSTSHISTIAAGAARFNGSTVIDLNLSGFAPTDLQTFDLLTAGTLTGFDNLVLASGDEYISGVQAGWTFQTDAAGTTLQAVYHAVPEPATMSLLGLGVVGLVLGRRRRAK